MSTTTQHTFNPAPTVFGSRWTWIGLCMIGGVILLVTVFTIAIRAVRGDGGGGESPVQWWKQQQQQQQRKIDQRVEAALQGAGGQTDGNADDDDLETVTDASSVSVSVSRLDDHSLELVLHFRRMCVVYAMLPVAILACHPWDTYILQHVVLNDWYGQINGLQLQLYALAGVTLLVLVYGWICTLVVCRESSDGSSRWMLSYVLITALVFAAIGYYGYIACDQSVCRAYNLTQSNANYPSEGVGVVMTLIGFVLCGVVLLLNLTTALQIVGLDTPRIGSDAKVKAFRGD